LRALLNAIGAALGFTPAKPGPTEPALSPARKGGRQRAYFSDRASTAAERGKRFRAKEANVSPNVCANVWPQESEQKKKKRGARADIKKVPFPDDWPSEEGRRFARERIGDELTEIECVIQRKYWSDRGEHRDDWDLVWLRRVRSLCEPMLPGFKPSARQLAVVPNAGDNNNGQFPKSQNGRGANGGSAAQFALKRALAKRRGAHGAGGDGN
jgi:hypothetical protein